MEHTDTIQYKRIKYMNNSQVHAIPAELLWMMVQYLTVREFERLASLSKTLKDRLLAIQNPFFRQKLEFEFGVDNLPSTLDTRTYYYALLHAPTMFRIAVWFKPLRAPGVSPRDSVPPDEIVRVGDRFTPLRTAVAKAFFKANPPFMHAGERSEPHLQGYLRILWRPSDDGSQDQRTGGTFTENFYHAFLVRPRTGPFDISVSIDNEIAKLFRRSDFIDAN